MDAQRDIILKSFLVESSEGLAQMEQSVLALEAHPGSLEPVQAIFRVVHTMKGNASLLELQALMAFAHKSEDLLDALRENAIPVDSEMTSLLLEIQDVLRDLVAAAGAGKDQLRRRDKEVLTKISRCLKARGSKKARQEAVAHSEDVATAVPAGEHHELHSAAHTESARTLRVDVEKLDRLLNLAGEITIAHGRVAQMIESKEKIDREEIRAAQSFAGALHLELQETILKTRMVPVGPLLRQYSRTVRDIAKSHGKLAQLHIIGEEVEVDTSIVEHLKDPLLHMIRNAVDHGIEPPELRRQKGKPVMGSITVRAAHEGGGIVVEVKDDGAGLDRQKILQAAHRRGIVADAERLSDADVYQMIFESGFSTAGVVSDLSGRGVGMDVVRRNVQALRGSVVISSEPGAGSTVHIRLPLTLAIIEGFGVGVGDETYVIPVDQVVECVELPAEENDSARAEGILQLRDEPLPFLFLKDHFGLPGKRTGRQNVVVVQHEANRAGLAVDVLHGATQTVIKPLPSLCKDVPGVSGSAILGNGRVALILDVPKLLDDFRLQELQTGKQAQI